MNDYQRSRWNSFWRSRLTEDWIICGTVVAVVIFCALMWTFR